MTCTEFRARYGEFRDGTLVVAGEARRLQRHLAQCEACQRFDATLRRGVDLLRAAAPVTASTGFRARLEARLTSERAAWSRRRAPTWLRVAAALFVVVAVALVASEARRRHTAAAPLPPVVFPKPVVNPGVPLVTFQDPRATILAGNTHPYGTAFVGPPPARR